MIFPFFAKHRKIENSMDYMSIFCFFVFDQKRKNRKTENAHKYIPFLRLHEKTEKWKMDKNIRLVSHKEDFSNFLIYLKIRKMEK